MRSAALISWLVTVSIGAFMLRTWLAHGGLSRERATAGGLPPQLIFGHATAALTGLLDWVAFLASGARPLAWAAVVLLAATVGLGLCTVTLWTPYPARKPGKRRPSSRWDTPVRNTSDTAPAFADPGPAPRPRPIRPNLAVLVPVAHGFAAIATFLLALMSAIT